MTAAPASPQITFILCSRNDDYQGNSRWRLETSLNWLGQRVHAMGRTADVEILVADWGSETPLRDVLHLTARAAPLVSFVEVPPDIARREQRDSPFPEVLALNAAARRARGEYIGRIDQDTLVGERFLRFFFAGLPGGRDLYFAHRRGIPYRFAQRQPSLAHLHRFVTRFGNSFQVFDDNPWYPGIFWAGFVGLWLLHRDLWHAAGGYDESLIYMNHMEIEMVDRLRSQAPVVDLGALVDHDFYHLDHYPHGSWWAGNHRKVNALPTLGVPRPLNPNGPQWGLQAHALEPAPYLQTRTPVPPREDRRSFPFMVAAAGARLAWDHRRDTDHLRRIGAGLTASLRRRRERP